jgi:serine/threonine protein kinase
MEIEHQLTHQPSKSFLNQFESPTKLGEGTYGLVTKLFDKRLHRWVALKKIKLDIQEDEGLPSTSIREIAILKMLKHPQIVE